MIGLIWLATVGPLASPALAAETSFIKLRNVDSGTVEVHLDSPLGGTCKAGNYTSDFSPADDASNGTWELVGYQNDAPMLGFIKLQNVDSGTVEVHLDALSADKTYERVGDYTSDFSPADASDGVWQLFGSPNGAPPALGFIKLQNTGSGTVEVHLDVLSGGSYKRVGDFTSPFSSADASNGVWQLLWSPNGWPALGFIKLRNVISGTVEVHLVEPFLGEPYKYVNNYTSDFSPADASNGVWQLFGSPNGAPILGFIKLQNVGTGTVEVHRDELTGGPCPPVGTSVCKQTYKRVVDYTSDFSPADASNGAWQLLAPAPSVDSVQHVTATTTWIALKALVNPNGSWTRYHFDYGPTIAYGSAEPVPDVPLGGCMTPVTVSQTISGLQPGTSYNFRLSATNEGGTTDSNNAVFSTVLPPPLVKTDPPTNLVIGQTDGKIPLNYAATLNGFVDTRGVANTFYQFQYGPTIGYESHSNGATIGTRTQSVSQPAFPLQPGTTYHFRLVAWNAGGTSYGNDVSFSTPGTPGGGTGSGYASLTVYNNIGSEHPVFVWLWDATIAQWFQENDRNELAYGGTTAAIPLTTDHNYLVYAVDRTMPYCASDYPTDQNCVAWFDPTPIPGNSSGAAGSITIQ
jgi:hypothetical protein